MLFPLLFLQIRPSSSLCEEPLSLSVDSLKILSRMRWQSEPRCRITLALFPPFLLLALVIAFARDAVHAFLPSTTVTQTKEVSIRASKGNAKKPTQVRLMMAASNREDGLKIAMVGAGPSGLLLSHLLQTDNENDDRQYSITIFDGRSDPRTNELEGRAYALGIGMRGRTAIRSAAPELWEAVKSRGFESERFKLHIGLSDKRDLVIPLRSDSKPSKDSSSSSSSSSSHGVVEPSLLIYQSELCASLLEELDEGDANKKKKKGNLELHFDTKVVDCNLDTMKIRALSPDGKNTAAETETSGDGTIAEFGPFDLIVGCDGVNSRVRTSIDEIFPQFSTTRERLPGFLKVVRLGYPIGTTSEDGRDAYDPAAVSLLIPSGAFIEPTGKDGSCCILFSGRGGGGEDDTSGLPVYLRETQNATAVEEALRNAFPRWKDESFPDIAEQLMGQDLTTAYSVTCNTYHYQDKVVLIGDAAHATGGVSGQGVNSALVDAMILAKSLRSSSNLGESLLAYSMRQVPEGRALYDLSFGPKPNGFKKKLLWGLKNIRDALFKGRLRIGEETLQTRLSSELTSFASIRREREYFYNANNRDDEKVQSSFPSDHDFRKQLEALHKI